MGSDDEVEFVGSTTSGTAETFRCQLCFEDLTRFTVDARVMHNAAHKEEQAKASAAKASSSAREKFTKPFNKLKQKLIKEPSNESFWFPSKGSPPPPNYTPSLIPLLRKYLLKLHDKGNIQIAYLCSTNAVHICHDGWDQGWGCGYRNFQMVCAVLAENDPLYLSLLDEPLPPGVRNLQKWIEQAWNGGFDAEGAKELKHELVGTTKWIGTAELYVAFSYRGIPCQLVDFDFTRKKDKKALTQWIVNYFSDSTKPATVNDALKGATPVMITERTPIILQNEGHSRTIIGFQRLKNNNVDLLMFDPTPLPKPIRFAALQTSSDDVADSRTLSSSHVHLFSPSKLFGKATSARDKDRKRKASDAGATATAQSAKRIRGDGSDKDVIVIDSDDENQPGPSKKPEPKAELDPVGVLKPFVLKADTLRKTKYQILYFPMTDPLDEKGRFACRVVTSIKGA